MKKNLILALFALVLMVSSAVAVEIQAVTVTSTSLIIPFPGTYPPKQTVWLGTYSLPWSQAGKSANIVATLPGGIPSGTYRLKLAGKDDVSVEIGSVTAEVGLSNSIIAEITRAEAAEAGLSNAISTETGLTNNVSAETARAIAAETGLSNAISSEVTSAMTAEAGLGNSISNEVARAIAAETGLSNAINSEIARATAAEAGLSNSIATIVNTASNSILASLTKDVTFVTVSTTALTIYSHSGPISFTNGTESIAGDTNGWSADGTGYTVPVSGIYEVSFTFNASYTDTHIIPNFTSPYEIDVTDYPGFTPFLFYLNSNSFSPNNPSTWSGQTTIQCSAGDRIVFYLSFSVNPNITFGNLSNGPLSSPAFQVTIKQIL